MGADRAEHLWVCSLVLSTYEVLKDSVLDDRLLISALSQRHSLHFPFRSIAFW
jgi:hypothetical protein